VNHGTIAEAPLGVVYFVQGEAGGPIKIGWSGAGEIKDRLHSIQVGYPYRLVVRRTIVGDRAKEAAYHRRFAAYRLNGEWFRPAAPVARLGHALPGDERAEATDPRPWRSVRAQAFRLGRIFGRYQGRVEGARDILDWLELESFDTLICDMERDDAERLWVRGAKSREFIQNYSADVLEWPRRFESVCAERASMFEDEETATHARYLAAGRGLLRNHHRPKVYR
jgi:hypothetical protein